MAPCMRTLKILFFAKVMLWSAFCHMPSLLFAAENDVISTTYLRSRVNARGEREVPLYEYMEIEAGKTPDAKLTLHTGGWFRYNLESFKNTANGDKSQDELSY